MNPEQMALTQNRLLLLCEAIPDCIDDPLGPFPIVPAVVRPAVQMEASHFAKTAQQKINSPHSEMKGNAKEYKLSLASSSILPSQSAMMDHRTNKVTRQAMLNANNNVAGAAFAGLNLGIGSPSGHSNPFMPTDRLIVDRLKRQSFPFSNSHSSLYSLGGSSMNGGNLSDYERDNSPVPPLLMSPIEVATTDTDAQSIMMCRTASLTGKRKQTYQPEKAIPIKLSKKLGAGYIIFGITSHFNAGDTEKLKETILLHSTEDCFFHVKSISGPTTGSMYIVSYLCSLLDALPDTYIITANETILDEYTLKVSIKFRGTKLHNTDTSAHFMKEHLVDNMNLSKFSEAEIAELRAQEASLTASMSPIELVFQGYVTVSFTEKIFDNRRRSMIDFSRITGKINSFILDYELKSFKDASIADPLAPL
jgi:hypothetical protein